VVHRGVAQRPLQLGSLDEVVPGLQRARPGEAFAFGGRHRFVNPRGGELRQSRAADLAGRDQSVERAEAVGERHRLVVLVLIIKIDRLNPEPFQRVVTGAGDPIGRETVEESNLGRDHHPVALGRVALQPTTDHGLAFAAVIARHPGRIDIGGIDHRAARIDERVENGETGLLVSGPAEHVAAKRERGDP
jgi:hypothetical protein